MSPWKAPDPKPYEVKLGSAFPVRWQYADPVSGQAIDSSGALPEVRLMGPVDCRTGDESNGSIQVFTPGNSTYQYDDRLEIHQLNVDTDNLLPNKCYNTYTYSGLTQQLNGPFIFKTKR